MALQGVANNRLGVYRIVRRGGDQTNWPDFLSFRPCAVRSTQTLNFCGALPLPKMETKSMREARPKFFEVGLFLALFASLAIVAQGAKKTSNAQFYHDSTVRGPIRPVDLSPLGKEVSSEIVAGPASGLETAFLIYTRMPAGSHGPAMYTLPVDHTYLVLAGKMNIELGTDKFVAGPDTLVLVHAGVPHEA